MNKVQEALIYWERMLELPETTDKDYIQGVIHGLRYANAIMLE